MPSELEGINGIMKEIYQHKIARQLEGLHPMAEQWIKDHSPNPNLRHAQTGMLSTIGEFKKFIADNNIPDDAEFYDGGYETDGSYYITWTVEDGKQEG